MRRVEPEARIAGAKVIRTARPGLHQATAAEGNHLPVMRLVQLRHRADGIDLPDHRPTCAVLESPDPGQAIIGHAAATRGAHIAPGARGHSTARRRPPRTAPPRYRPRQ